MSVLIDANTKVDDIQPFNFIGAHAFHHKAGELHFVSDHHHGVFVENLSPNVHGSRVHSPPQSDSRASKIRDGVPGLG